MYKIRFADIDGTLHNVDVGDTEEEKILKGATDAFQVSEDDSTDMFTPVRTQSGYLTFVDSDGDWESLIPAPGSYMPVALDQVTGGQGSTWSGWVATPESGFPYMEVNPDVKIPVMCPLSLLETFDFYPVNGQVVLRRISDLIADISSIYLTNTGKGLNTGSLPTGASDLATYWVSTGVFFDIDSEGRTSAKYNCLEALQEICTFLGVTARWTGNAVVFEGADIITAGTSVVASFADVNHEQGYYQGFREVTVNPNLDEADDTYEIPGKKILNDILAEENVPTTEIIEEDEHGDGRFARIAGTITSGTVKGETVDITLTSSSIYPSSSILVYEYYEGRRNRDFTGNWLCGVKITEEDAGSNPCVIIETHDIISLSYTAIEITADVAEHYAPLDKEVEGYLIAELKVGNYYFRNPGWSTTERQFNLYFNKKIGPRADSTIKEGLYVRARGIGKISGKITLRIYGYEKTDGSANDAHLILSNFKIELENLYPDYLKGREEIFKIENGTKFRDKKEVRTIFCSAVPASNVTNCLYNDAEGIVDTITIGTYTGKPEMWLAQRISSYSARKRHFLLLNLKGNISNSATYTAGLRNYHCYAASHDYAENITTLNLIEI